MPRFAAIDVGSNALRLRIVEASAPSLGYNGDGRPRDRAQLQLLADRDSPTGWREIVSQRAPVRLGSEVFTTGKLAPASIGQACEALREFRAAMDAAKVDAYRATATSAVREARNGATLVERARREARIDLEPIEGIEEARLIQLAVMRRWPLQAKKALLVDVGGGSTELTVLEGSHTVFATSLPLGTVRLLELYLRGAKTVDRNREKLVDETIQRAIGEAMQKLKPGKYTVMIGTGGNIETLADLCPMKGGFGAFPRAIDVAQMRALNKKLCGMTPNERKDAYGLRPDRADTIVPASAIFLRLAQSFDQPAIVAPGVGLTAGILEELVDKFFDVWDTAGEAESVIAACERIGTKYSFDEAHAKRVVRFASQLFDDLQDVHAFGARERLLLRAAATLHDIGDFVHYNGHHKHSYYLIEHADIMGITPDERSIIANIARYHRKSPPDPAHPNFRELDKEARGKVRGLAAILRVADALDREHKGKIESVRAAIDRSGGKVTLFLRGDDERELEEWSVGAKSTLLRDVYDLDVEIARGDVKE
jgi:exopolyphosphatase/guanosine-5'-triphosphate,3'-diphosphate pyrophosphatase